MSGRLSVIHVVRRYGCVGGMESYVWHLTRCLAAKGVDVSVLCEAQFGDAPPGVRVTALGTVRERPRWLALLRFSGRVGRLLRDRAPGTLVHSHERTAVHDVTTFHGPPFAHVRQRPFWKLISLRIWAHLWMERRELLGPRVRRVVPNSPAIAGELAHYYPEVRARMAEPIAPGLPEVPARTEPPVEKSSRVVGFVGKEWRRKGLERAIEVFRALRAARPGLRMLVIGPEPVEIAPLLQGIEESVSCLGWTSAIGHYRTLELLIHPATAEPYGMVVAEAMAARVPVVVSGESGVSADVTPAHGRVLAAAAPLREWVDACEEMLSRADLPPGFDRPWERVADEYLAVYEELA